MPMYDFKRKSTRWVDADTAIRSIKKGKRILIGSGGAQPQHLVAALTRNAPLFRDNEVVHLLTLGTAPYTDPVYAAAFRHNAFFIGPNVRYAVSEGHADYTPIFLSEIPALFKTGQMPVHCAMIQVSSPDKNNWVSLGVSVDILSAAVASADMVIAQMNSLMPETLGESKIPLDCLDYIVKVDEPLVELPMKDPDEVSIKIGKNIVRYIQDGDTLQLGIGTIPDAVLKNLTQKNDLGIHSEITTH
jgi:acyl-CoA hydrolase